MTRMLKPSLIAACALVVSHAALAQVKAAASSPFFQEASDCAAAFEARVNEHRAQPPSEPRNQAILQDTQWGFLYVGLAYEQGLRKPEADQLFQASKKRWSALGKVEQHNTLTTCTAQAQTLMKEINAMERFIVKNRAQARVDKLLEKDKPER